MMQVHTLNKKQESASLEMEAADRRPGLLVRATVMREVLVAVHFLGGIPSPSSRKMLLLLLALFLRNIVSL